MNANEDCYEEITEFALLTKSCLNLLNVAKVRELHNQYLSF
jgi:hypothetical protein